MWPGRGFLRCRGELLAWGLLLRVMDGVIRWQRLRMWLPGSAMDGVLRWQRLRVRAWVTGKLMESAVNSTLRR